MSYEEDTKSPGSVADSSGHHITSKAGFERFALCCVVYGESNRSVSPICHSLSYQH